MTEPTEPEAATVESTALDPEDQGDEQGGNEAAKYRRQLRDVEKALADEQAKSAEIAAKLDALQLSSDRAEVLAEFGLSGKAAGLVKGSTRDELAASAAEVASAFPSGVPGAGVAGQLGAPIPLGPDKPSFASALKPRGRG